MPLIFLEFKGRKTGSEPLPLCSSLAPNSSCCAGTLSQLEMLTWHRPRDHTPRAENCLPWASPKIADVQRVAASA